MILERKEDWIKEIQKTIEADWKPKMIKVTYELFDPEIENMQKFFNGPVVEYYAIQSREELSAEVDPTLKKITRESILDEILGYEVQLVNKTVRRRKSTADFKNQQKWYDFLQTVKETLFEPNGYEFPNSEEYWNTAQKYSYDQAKTIAIEDLLKRVSAKLSP